jgi:hypothetical protein
MPSSGIVRHRSPIGQSASVLQSSTPLARPPKPPPPPPASGLPQVAWHWAIAPPTLRLPQHTSPALQFDGPVHESDPTPVHPPIGAQLSLAPPAPMPTQHCCVVESHVIDPHVSVVDAGPEPLLALPLDSLSDPLLPDSPPVEPPVDAPLDPRLFVPELEPPPDPVPDPVGLVVPSVS